MNRLQAAIYKQLDTEAWPKIGLSPVNRIIILLILVSSLLAVLQTEAALFQQYREWFRWANDIFLACFVVEYLLRLWSEGCDPRYEGFVGRLRYMVTWPALVDLAAILPFLVGLTGSDIFLVRLLRLLRILALMRTGRFARALRTLGHAVSERRFELVIAVGVAGCAVFVAAILLYLAESTAQPEAFGSIPRALWWGITTLTTVGYGDVVPITLLGRIFAGLFMMASISIIALPAGIFAAAISDLLQARRREEEERRDRIRQRDSNLPR